MRKWIPALALILLGACTGTRAAGDGGPTRSFNGEHFTGLVTEKVERYEDAELDYDFDSTRGVPIHITRCPQAEALREDQVVPAQFPLYRLLRTNCLALKRYAESRSAERTYFPAHLTEALVLSLAATAVPQLGGEYPERRPGRPLSDSQEGTKASLLPDGGVQVISGEDELTYYLLGRGDFDADGAEDLLVRVDWRALDAMGEGTDLLILSRTAADAPVAVTRAS